MSSPQDNLILFTPGTIIQSAQVNQNLNDIVGLSGGAVGSQLQTLLSNNFNGFVQSGGIITTASGLTVNMSAAYVVVAGITYYMPAQSFTVTASKDTYIDFVPGSVPTYQAQNVANGGTAPNLYATNAVRMGVVVSGASTITLITQTGGDNQGHLIYPLVLNTSRITNPYKFRVYRTSALNVTSSYTVMAADTKSYDTGTNVDIVTNKGRFTATTAGFYHFNGRAGYSGSAGTAVMVVALYKNGVADSYGSVAGTTAGNTATASNVSNEIQLAAGDYVELFMIANGTIALDVSSQGTCYFSGFLVSAT